MKEICIKDHWMIHYEKMDEEKAKYLAYFLLMELEMDNFDILDIYLNGCFFSKFKILSQEKDQNKETVTHQIMGNILDEKSCLTINVESEKMSCEMGQKIIVSEQEWAQKRDIFKIYDGNIVRIKIENLEMDPNIFISNVDSDTLEQYSLEHFLQDFDEKSRKLIV